MTAIEDLTNGEIEQTIAHHNTEIARLEAEQARRQSEQESKALAEYWKAHPELTPIYQGDKLVNDIKFEDHYDDKSILTVTEVFSDSRICRVVDDKGSNIAITAAHAQRFRRAYLQSVAANGEGN